MSGKAICYMDALGLINPYVASYRDFGTMNEFLNIQTSTLKISRSIYLCYIVSLIGNLN